MEIRERSLWLMAKAIIKDARVQAIAGSKDERSDLRKWIQNHPAPWTFEDTCHLLHFDDGQMEKMRADINRRLDMASQLRDR